MSQDKRVGSGLILGLQIGTQFCPGNDERQPAFGGRAVKLSPEVKLGFFVVWKRRKPLVL